MISGLIAWETLKAAAVLTTPMLFAGLAFTGLSAMAKAVNSRSREYSERKNEKQQPDPEPARLSPDQE